MDVKQLVTAEELLALPEVAGTRYELVDGELVAVPGASPLHGLLVELVLRLIGAYARERDLGLAFADGTAYLLRRGPDRVRIPDVSFVAWARVPIEGVPDEGFWPFAPDLAVEIVSPGDRASDVHSKVDEYLAAGTRLVWVLWPQGQSVTARGGRTTARAGSGRRARWRRRAPWLPDSGARAVRCPPSALGQVGLSWPRSLSVRHYVARP